MWSWARPHVILDTLADEPDDMIVDDVLDALDAVLLDPSAPPGLDVDVLGRSRSGVERLLAWLPHGYWLSYSPYPVGPPPLAGSHVLVRAMGKWPPNLA